MERVEEIETAIDRLPSEDYSRLVAWLRDDEQSRWDEQTDRDSSGRCLHVFGMIGILAMSSGVGTTASKLRGTGESAYSTLIQKHLSGDVE
jgi:hypothetical protein